MRARGGRWIRAAEGQEFGAFLSGLPPSKYMYSEPGAAYFVVSYAITTEYTGKPQPQPQPQPHMLSCALKLVSAVCLYKGGAIVLA